LIRIGILANEPSGDQLGAGLIKALRARYDDVRIEGVGGPLMEQQGCISLYPMERLSVMGFTEVFKHLPELLGIRRRLVRHFIDTRPDLFIGIDAPDFNIGLEHRLKKAGIPTVHYVSPTVWAWRPKRVNKIRQSVDLLLSIFPFEVEFLTKHRVPVCYVGHPLADEIPLENSRTEAREQLGISPQDRVIAILPGSRVSEIKALSETFLAAARQCRARDESCRFLVPLVNERTRGEFQSIRQAFAPDLPLTLLTGRSRIVMQAADVVLTASGTATLEALLFKRPMVVAYRLSPITFWIARGLNLVKTPYIAMANLLAGEKIAPEFIQHQATPEALCDALFGFLDFPERMEAMQRVCMRVHRELRQDSSRKAAEAIVRLLEDG
jgi:lipid-A-disaccharide synthase